MNKNTTVGDCLNLSALREAELIAGAKGLNRPVSSVSVLEWPVVEALSKDVLSRSARRIFCTGDFAEAHGVSSAQVILRWNLQKGVVVIPGSSDPDHIKENTQLYHFELTENEMNCINALDRNEKHDWY